MKRKNDDKLTELRDAFIFGRLVEDFCENDLIRFFNYNGLSTHAAREVSRATLGWWNSFTGAVRPDDFRTAVGFGMQSYLHFLPDIMLQQAPGDGEDENKDDVKDDRHGPRPLPEIEQSDPVTVEGHGTVRRGTVDEDSDGNPIRPHIYLWFERNAAAPCKEYLWFQFVHSSIWIGTTANNLRDKTNDLSRKEKKITASTGLETVFCQWNPDYQKNEIEAEEKKTGKEKPEFKPPANEFRRTDKAKPYTQRPIPNEDGRLGLVDAPDWGSRTRDPKSGDEQHSPMEIMWRRVGRRKCVKSRQQPPNGTEVVEIRMEFRSYLVCADTGRCIGYIPWTATNRATITYQWHLKPNEVPEAGIVGANRKRKWCTSTGISAAEYEVNINDWVSC